MFGWSAKEKYQHYITWFSENAKDPSNWGWMRADRDCCNWMDKDSAPRPYEFGEASLMMSDPKKMTKALTKKIESNHIKYTNMGQYINGDPKNGTVNKENLERFENTKKLREQLRAYSGSDEAAADLLFQMKQQADAEGKDFSQISAKKIDEMKGSHIVDTAPTKGTQSKTLEQSKEETTLAADFIHLLWKAGLPVDKLFKNKLSVDVADSISKKES